MTDATNTLKESLLQEYLYDPETGNISRRSNPSRILGTKRPDGYVRIHRRGGYHIYAHRLAYLLMTGDWPPYGVDHINRDTSDNRWCNLRPADQSENNANSGGMPTNKSGFRGVSYFKRDGNWVAFISIRGKRKNLGYFNTPEEAHKAYCEAKTKAFGEYARTSIDIKSRRY